MFLDECGVLTNMACLYGRAPRGQRARGTAPAGRWKRVTVLGAFGAEGMVAAMSVEAATDDAVFTAFLDQVLLPRLGQTCPGAVLVMDNVAAHMTPAVRRPLDGSGFACRCLPAYSPDLNPIEPSWAKLKGTLHQVAARTADALHQALGPALDAITPQDAQGCFRHSGYSPAGLK